MAKNQRYTNALHITLPVPEGTTSGKPVSVGLIRGVAITDRHDDGTATVWLDGSWDIPVAGAVSTAGQAIYINSSGALTATEGGDFWGVALATKAAGTAPLEVVPAGYVQP
jgi:predicted RecA/RadA family phage recombinase